jgi:ABC-type Co2+ transport system permease subunit
MVLHLFWFYQRGKLADWPKKEKERRKSKFTLHAQFFYVVSNFVHSYCEETKTHFLM